MKVALVHDFLNQFGGAERVLLALSNLYPDAPIYTLLYDNEKMGNVFSGKKIITSNLQNHKFLARRHKYLLPFYKTAIEQFDFSEFDVVISSSNSYAKGVLTKSHVPQICYCHAPTRYLWDWYHEYLAEQNLGKLKTAVVLPILSKIRMWDRVSAERVDYWIANSKNTASRIRKYYKQESTVIHPPVDISQFKIAPKTEDYFLVVSRLSAYKRVDLAVEAFNKNGLPLVIIGEGPEREKLEKVAKPNIKFLGFQPDEVIQKHYSACRAFVFTTWDEDFGLTPVEAMASGRLVIAPHKGGVLESVVEGQTGEFFNAPTPEAVLEAVEKFLKNETQYNPEKIREHARQFDTKEFQSKITDFVQKAVLEYKEKMGA